MKKVGIIMGSKSDLPIMQDAINILKNLTSNLRLILYLHTEPQIKCLPTQVRQRIMV